MNSDDFNQFRIGSEAVALRYLREALPGSIWSARKLRELANDKTIEGAKVGRRSFFKRSDLDAITAR